MKGVNNLLKKCYHSNLFWPLIALTLVLIFNLVFNPLFFRLEIKDGHLFGSLVDVLNRGAALMILAIGMTFVVATGGIDISVGSNIAIAGAVAASLIGGSLMGSQTPIILVVLAVVMVSVALGLWNGYLVAKIGIQPVVATLILMVAGRGLAQLLTKGQIITIYEPAYYFIGGGYFLGLPFSIFVVLGLFLLALVIRYKTALGLFIESVGCNPDASRLCGLSVSRIKLFAYALSGLCAGIAGMIISANVKCADSNNAGLFIEMDAILSVALGGNSLKGGRFSIGGSIIGALIIQSITTTIYAIGVAPEITLVVKAIVVIIICLLQSKAFRDRCLGIIKRGRKVHESLEA